MTGTQDAPRRRAHEEAIATAVARHVRTLRQARRWSLDELAGRSGVSKGMVVQIEGARTNPSVGTLCRLADAFGVTVARLLEQSAEPPVRVTGADEPPVLWRGSAGGTARLLSAVSDPYPVELWEWRFAPGERHGAVAHSPGSREVLHLHAGRLVVTVADVEYPVEAGESIDFAADRPHGYRNDGTEPAVLTMVVAARPDEWDRRVM